MKKTLLLLAAVVALAACIKTVEVPVEVEVEKIVDLLTLNAAQLQVSNAAVDQPLSFTTEDAWTISSDVDWITFDKTSGAAGSSTVTMKVAKNEGYNARTGRVTLSCSHGTTTKNTVFTVIQSEKEVFNSTVFLPIDYKAQAVEVTVTTNLEPEVNIVEGAEWLSILGSKAEPVEGTITICAGENDGLDTRVGAFTVFAGNSLQTYKVVQASQYAAASNASASFLGNSQDCWSDDLYNFKEIAQFAIQFETAEGQVNLVLNVDPAIEDKTKVPAGTYTMDDAATYAAGTFAIPTGAQQQYLYTTVVSGEKEMTVIDGNINVAKDGDIYSVVAELTDIAGTPHLYSYKGELTVTDASLGTHVYSAKNDGQYNTYYSTQAYETVLGLHFNQPIGSGHHYSYIQFNMFTAAESGGKLPTGKFTYQAPETNAELGYANGVQISPAGTFFIGSIGKVDWESGVSHAPKEGATNTLEITKQDNGRYTIAIDVTMVRSVTEGETTTTEDVPLKATLTNVAVGELAAGQVVYPDGDVEFSSVMIQSQYMPFWYGDAFNTGCNAFTFGWNYVNNNYNVYLAINVKDDEWTFTKDMGNYCTTPFKLGTFTYATTPGEHTLIPAKNYHRIQNLYTGHIYTIVGGSITLTSEGVTYDLTTTYGDATYHITGGHPATLYYMRNYSTRTLTLD